jgi:branched-chain amino acid transport system permease protein
LRNPAAPAGASERRRTSARAVDDPGSFLATLLDGVTAAGVYFVVASGFTLIFGLMRVVNMAHGAFFLLGGYIALKLQRAFVGEDSAIRPVELQVHFWQCSCPP